MNRFLRTALGLVTVTAAIMASAQTVYNPTRPVKDQGITLKSWGSGTISETDETAFEGASSIRVSSRNYFQGGIVNFGSAVNLAGAYDDKNNLLQFTMHLPESTGAPAGGGGASGVGGGKGRGGGLPGGGGDLGANQGGGKEGGVGGKGGGAGSTTSTLTSDKTLEKVRLVITTTDGLKSETFLDVKDKVADARGWVKAGIPLQAISGFARTNKIVQSIAFAGDAISTFYIGEASILSDSTPVYGEMNQGDMNLALGDEITFIGNGYAGASPIKYEWDFDSSDGVQVDATGAAVKRRFRKAGEYTVTLTVSDMYGLKAPHKSSVKVVVNP